MTRTPRGALQEVPEPVVLPAAAHAYLTRSARSLAEALTADTASSRYAYAHVSALQATAAVLAARADLTPRRRSRNAWVLLSAAAPELDSWAQYFSSGAATYQAAQAGSRRVSQDAADQAVRDADRFLGVIESHLGLLRHAPVVPDDPDARVVAAPASSA